MIVTELDTKKRIISLIPEGDEDLYILSLLIEKGDRIYSWTTRSLKFERATGSIKGDRVKMYIGLRVKEIEFQEFTGKLRIRGIIIEAPERFHIKGNYHTLSVDKGKEIRIIKTNEILKAYLKMLKKGIRDRYLLISIGDDEIAVAFLRYEGLEITSRIPLRVSYSEKDIKSRYAEFIENFASSIKNYYRNNITILLLSPFFYNFMKDYISRIFKESKKIYTYKVSEGGISGIYEFIRSGNAYKLAKDLLILKGNELIKKAIDTLTNSPQKILIHYEKIKKAATEGSIETLIVLDEVFRKMISNNEFKTMLQKIEEYNGKIEIIPRESESGKKLRKLGGIIAFLRYSISY